MKRMMLIGAAVVALGMMGGVAWAATTIQCPNDPENYGEGYCEGTQGNDAITGTTGDDFIQTEDGNDITYARPGDDFISSGEADVHLGKDETHGGPGNDHIVGNLESERNFGGRGDDLISDHKSLRHPDVFNCGPGHDEIYYNRGLDKVSGDCEIRHNMKLH